LTDDRACGADDVVGACPGQMLRKLRFLMTDYRLPFDFAFSVVAM
jgi:hypothetical protein